VVAEITDPDGLISTTTTFASPWLFESSARPVILTVERKRGLAAITVSSDGNVD